MVGYYPVFLKRIREVFHSKTIPGAVKVLSQCKEELRQYDANLELAASKTLTEATYHSSAKKKRPEFDGEEGDEEEAEDEYDSGDSFLADDGEGEDGPALRATPKKKLRPRAAELDEALESGLQKPQYAGNRSPEVSPLWVFADVNSRDADRPRVLQLD